MWFHQSAKHFNRFRLRNPWRPHLMVSLIEMQNGGPQQIVLTPIISTGWLLDLIATLKPMGQHRTCRGGQVAHTTYHTAGVRQLSK